MFLMMSPVINVAHGPLGRSNALAPKIVKSLDLIGKVKVKQIAKQKQT